MPSVLFLALGKRRGERDKETRNKIIITLCPSPCICQDESESFSWKVKVRGDGYNTRVCKSRKPEVLQTSHDGGAWPHVPCIDLLALPHIKIDQTETIHAHPRDSASKPLLFAPRPADNVSKLARATTWALWQSSLP